MLNVAAYIYLCIYIYVYMYIKAYIYLCLPTRLHAFLALKCVFLALQETRVSKLSSGSYCEKNYTEKTMFPFHIEWDMIVVTVFLSILNQNVLIRSLRSMNSFEFFWITKKKQRIYSLIWWVNVSLQGTFFSRKYLEISEPIIQY